MTDLVQILKALQNAGVEFIVVGGVAGNAHGVGRLTEDVDIVYSRTPENLERIVNLLRPYHPYLRGVPAGLPFLWDVETLRRGLNFTLMTDLGPIDLFGEITGGGTFEELKSFVVVMEPFGIPCPVLDLDPLIRVKRAAGRPKDLLDVAMLEALLEERMHEHDSME